MLQTKRKVVISVHGIESHGVWEMDLAPLISEQGWIYFPLHYGTFHWYQLLFPRARAKKVNWFRDQYNDICGRYRNIRPSVIAHSFGTYIVAMALQKHPNIKLDKLILCGSIIHPNFDWSGIISDKKQLTRVRNDYSKRDFLVGRAQLIGKEFGLSGKEGFSSTHDRLTQISFPHYDHRSMFGDDHYKDWITFLKRSEPYEGEKEPPSEYEEPVSPLDAARWSAITYYHQYVLPGADAITRADIVDITSMTPVNAERLVVLVPKVPSQSSTRLDEFKKFKTTKVAIRGDLNRVYEKLGSELVDIPRILASLSYLDKREDNELVDAVNEFAEMLKSLVHSTRHGRPNRVRIEQLEDFKPMIPAQQ